MKAAYGANLARQRMVILDKFCGDTVFSHALPAVALAEKATMIAKAGWCQAQNARQGCFFDYQRSSLSLLLRGLRHAAKVSYQKVTQFFDLSEAKQ